MREKRVKQVVTKQVEDGGQSQRLCLARSVFAAGTAVFMLLSLKNILFFPPFKEQNKQLVMFGITAMTARANY